MVATFSLEMEAEFEEQSFIKRELARGIDDWEQRRGTALVKSAPTDLVRRTPPADAPEADDRTPTRKTNS